MFRDNTIVQVWDLCGDVAKNVYRSNRAPSAEYADRVQTILFMIASHESGGFIHRRQMGFGRFGDRGAFSLWQVQWNSITDSLHRIAQDSEMENRIILLCERNGISRPPLSFKRKDELLLALQQTSGDILGAVLARLHLLGRPGAIPQDISEMAQYAKEQYNTRGGSATPELYMRHFGQAYGRLQMLLLDRQAKADNQQEE